jgi:hypothetical protein
MFCLEKNMVIFISPVRLIFRWALRVAHGFDENHSPHNSTSAIHGPSCYLPLPQWPA